MKKLYDVLVETWISTSFAANRENKKHIDLWKCELRHHDITCDVVNLLDGNPQGTKYHPEFDAFTHTYYVVKAVWKSQILSLLEAAFLHDVGKAFKTNIGKDRIYHFGHAKSSVEYIEKIKDNLKYYELTKRVVEKHMDFQPNNKILSDDPELDIMVYCDKVLSKKLYELESTSLDRFINKLREKAILLKQQYSRKKIYVMVGIPGSGKSRYLKNVKPHLIVSPDDIRRELTGDVNDQSKNREVWEETKIRLKIVLFKYGEVYLDATNVVKFRRVEFMSDFNYAKKIAVVFDVQPEVALERITEDILHHRDRADVPEKVIRKMHKMFERGKQSLQNEFNKVIYY